MNNKKIVILTPVYNDWKSFQILLERLNKLASNYQWVLCVNAVNDGSIQKIPDEFGEQERYSHIHAIKVIDLKGNVGHQKAIAIGLGSLCTEVEYDAIVVLDSDGEDDPKYIPEMLSKFFSHPDSAILAKRVQRSEGVVFKLFYHIYKNLFRFLTGVAISFGNFCVISPAIAQKLTSSSDLINSFPATILQTKVPYLTVDTKRSERYCGSSQMNFVGLILHGLRAITVFSEIVIVRLALMVFSTGFFAAVIIVLIRFNTEWVISGWASNMIGFLFMYIFITLLGLIIGGILTLQARKNLQFIPSLHWELYLEKSKTMFDKSR